MTDVTVDNSKTLYVKTGESGDTAGSESTLNDLLCCPFCGGSNLTNGYWSLDDGEVDAIECGDCYAGAPITAWIKRTNELPAEGTILFFEDEKWVVVNHNYKQGSRSIEMTLELTNEDVLQQENTPEEFKLTAT